MKKLLVILFLLVLFCAGWANKFVQIRIDTPHTVVATNFFTLSVRDEQGNTLYSLQIKPAQYAAKAGTLEIVANQSVEVLLKIWPTLFLSPNFLPQNMSLVLNSKKLKPQQTWKTKNSMEVYFEKVLIPNSSAVFKLCF